MSSVHRPWTMDHRDKGRPTSGFRSMVDHIDSYRSSLPGHPGNPLDDLEHMLRVDRARGRTNTVNTTRSILSTLHDCAREEYTKSRPGYPGRRLERFSRRWRPALPEQQHRSQSERYSANDQREDGQRGRRLDEPALILVHDHAHRDADVSDAHDYQAGRARITRDEGRLADVSADVQLAQGRPCRCLQLPHWLARDDVPERVHQPHRDLRRLTAV